MSIYYAYVAETCIVTAVTGNVKHNRRKKRTLLTFAADKENATFECKLDKGNFQHCEFMI